MRISVKVLPRAPKEEVVELEDGTFKAYLKAAPADGKANISLIAVLAEFFSVKKSDIKIITGLTSRKKIVEIDNK
ncbi:MAG: DUF167 domain-containing protein [Candidatus Omnitrophota bacterium]